MPDKQQSQSPSDCSNHTEAEPSKSGQQVSYPINDDKNGSLSKQGAGEAEEIDTEEMAKVVYGTQSFGA